jgi:hypothetical protein
MTGKSKERIGAISKDIFSNEDFREANMVILVRLCLSAHVPMYVV